MAGRALPGIFEVLMTRRLGLQSRMAISFVVATVAIVIFIEALAGAVFIPRITKGSEVTVRALDTAEGLAKQAGAYETRTGSLPSGQINEKTNEIVPAPSATVEPAPPPGEIAPVTLILDTSGRIVASSQPDSYPIGVDARKLAPPEVIAELGGHQRSAVSVANGAAAIADLKGGKLAWALVAIRVPAASASPAAEKATNPGTGDVTGTVGYSYAQLPATKGLVLGHRLSSATWVLLLTVPVGVVFGLWTTRSLRRRLRRLTDASQAVASGDFTTRIDSDSTDDIGKLEQNFNDMTTRLGEASERELLLASQNARLAERSRISRELHDSISQDLFSLSLLSGGLQRALPEDSPLQTQVGRISDTVATAIHEMRALVLDLHPSALSEKGLRPAIEDLCASYRARLGLVVNARLDPVDLDEASQHAVLRVAQEALANATKHADAANIAVELHAVPGGTELVVTDDGRGFDPDVVATPSGVGLRLMRERINELGGNLIVESRPGGGTTVRAVIPTPEAAAQSQEASPAGNVR
jgi:signal transduction histidine kinase